MATWSRDYVQKYRPRIDPNRKMSTQELVPNTKCEYTSSAPALRLRPKKPSRIESALRASACRHASTVLFRDSSDVVLCLNAHTREAGIFGPGHQEGAENGIATPMPGRVANHP